MTELGPANRAGVLAIWEENLAGGHEFGRKLGWFYDQAPAGPGIVLVLNDDQGQVVGATGVGRRLFYVHGHPHVAGLNADFAIAPRHRTVMPALILQREARRRSRSAFPLAYGFPNPAAIGVFARIGYQKVGPLQRYTRVLHHEKYVHRVRHLGVAARVVGPLLDALVGLYHAPRRISARLQNRLEWPSRADERFDRLVDRLRGRYPIFGDRSSRFLDWRFHSDPGRPHDLVAMRRDRGSELVGYAVLEHRAGVAVIRDVLAESDQELRAFLELLADALAKRGSDSMTLRFLGDHGVVEALGSAGFFAREPPDTIVIDGGDSSPFELGVLRDVSQWYVTDADEDD